MGLFGHDKIFGGMVVRYMANSGHGEPPGTRVMTIFVFYVSPQIPNIEYFVVYGGLQAPEGISFFAHQISRRMSSESCLGTHF